jgi:amino acid transporter
VLTLHVQTDQALDDLPAGAATGTGVPPPRATPHLVELPEPLGYRIKKRLLGPPLDTDQLAHERLGKPTALAVFASDNLSSSAYATEEFLHVLVPAVGLLAFSLVLPLTVAMLVVLFLLILSYRQTIKAYPSAGGAYIVTKDNFGSGLAQVAGVALLMGYVLTAAVSAAAGAAAAASAVPALAPFVLPIAIFFLLIIAGGNLKGVKESGKAFAIPTYFFMANMAVLLGLGAVRWLTGGLSMVVAEEGHHAPEFGVEHPEMWMGVGLVVLLQAFARGGAAVTGVEAISNGVPAFKEPAAKHASQTLVIMGALLGVMFFGLSALASKVHPLPYEGGTPTVISQIGKAVYGLYGGQNAVGQGLWISLQLGTMLILILAANTSYADFPRLASFQASDNFMPRQLTKRGHRLVFSNGIIALTAVAIVFMVFTGAKVEKLIPMYAIGVFTGFALSQSGMTKHHWRLRQRGWKMGMFVNGVGAAISIGVLLISAWFNFTSGAWFIIVLIPLAVIPLFRLNRQYEEEEAELVSDAKAAAEAPILNRHVAIVLLDTLDMAAARAIQYARALNPDELMAVHFDLDPIRTRDLTGAWSRLGFTRLSLDVVECPDRRIERAAAEVAARHLVHGDTEVSVLIPRLEHSKVWHRLVHDRTADKLAETLAELPHCNVTIVPYHLARSTAPPQLRTPIPATAGAAPPPATSRRDAATAAGIGTGGGKIRLRKSRNGAPTVSLGPDVPPDRVPIADVAFRKRAKIMGKVHSLRVQPWSGVASLELSVVDDTGAITVVFFGRRHLAGVHTGSRVIVEGVVGEHRGTMAMLNPAYEILADGRAADHT